MAHICHDVRFVQRMKMQLVNWLLYIVIQKTWNLRIYVGWYIQ
jgi:hypothetical protein